MNLLRQEKNDNKQLIASEERVSDINIQEAVIHILDSNAGEPLLNEYTIDLTEEAYKFIYRHIEKCLKSDNLKFAIYEEDRNIVREVVNDYLTGNNSNIIEVSQEIAKQYYAIMNGNENIPSGDLLIVSIVTDKGPLVAILKMDYVKNFTHEVNFKNEKMDIGLIPHNAGLPGASQKIQKAAFIRPYSVDNKYDLLVIDEASRKKVSEDEYGADYFVKHLLGCSIVDSSTDYTRRFSEAVESWTRTNVVEDAERAERIRGEVSRALKDNDVISIDEISTCLFEGELMTKENFSEFVKANSVPEEFVIDKGFAEKKVSKKKIKIDNDILLTISQESYSDLSKFEIVKNGDGTINMVIKNIANYIEK